jgi:predicted ATPase/DNA-binding CsgD family transcriptional regulator
VSAGAAQLASRLPAEVTSFVGRRHELAEARRLMSVSRLLTLTGPGGVGKTRLALRLADQVRRAFADGVYFVELDALNDPGLLPQTVATALGISDASDDPVATLAYNVEDKRMLVVLDNCEHLVEACAVLTHKLLAASPDLRILATSRHVLGVEGEQTMPVPPLPLPEDGPASGRAGGGASYDALGLFADRASAVLPGFRLDESNSDRVLQICRLLDGVPLALELAAVRLRVLSLDDILDRLGDRFELLVGGSRAAPSRQQTLVGAVDWSYDLCSPEERLVWARLSVFAGSFDIDAAEQVACGEGVAHEEVLGYVAGLMDKSILIRQPNSHGRLVRYRMLETIRRYGLARLESSGEEQAARARHLEYYRQLALRYKTERFSPLQVQWIQQLTAEHSNLRVALEFGLSTDGQTVAAMEVSAALWNFWFAGGFLQEGLRWLERALSVNTEPTRSRAEALWTCAFLSVHSGYGDAAQRMVEECAVLAERFGDDLLEAHLALCCGQIALLRGDMAEASSLLEASAAQHRGAGHLLGLADSLILLTVVRLFLDDPRGAATAAEALELCQAHGAGWTEGYALWATALFKWHDGAPAEGVALLERAIRMHRDHQDWTGLAYQLELLSWCTAALGRYERVGHLLGAAASVWRLSGAKSYEAPPYHAIDEQTARQARAAIGDEAFEAACAEGGRLSLDDVIAYALEDKTGEPTPASGQGKLQDTGGLTRREREIAELVAEGLTNRDIASRLTISQRTAEGHVEKVLAKLGFTSRTQIAAWVADQRAAT